MLRHRLLPHPATPPGAVTGVRCRVAADGAGRIALDFAVDAPAGALALPPPQAPGRADELWETTCFELFLRRAGENSYVEFNLSPSGLWAAYRFDGYRQGMAALDIPSPLIEREVGENRSFRLRASLHAQGPWRASLSAVIEEADGTKSYWALAHGSDKPDFHHPDSFVLELP